ncbi:MAG: Holliday junction branch migration protein RuvA [Bacillota bacterium]
MIAFLRGKLHSVKGDAVTVDVNGVGYMVYVPLSVIPGLPSPGQDVLLHTYMAVREDGMSLYGFDTVDALDIFCLLLNVNGVGPRGALSLLSVITPHNLVLAVKSENTGLITRAPGIGKKIAQRIILELKDKLKAEEYTYGSETMPPKQGEAAGDAVEALLSLGYGMSQASQAVERAMADLGAGEGTAQLVRLALRHLSEQRLGRP